MHRTERHAATTREVLPKAVGVALTMRRLPGSTFCRRLWIGIATGRSRLANCKPRHRVAEGDTNDGTGYPRLQYQRTHANDYQPGDRSQAQGQPTNQKAHRFLASPPPEKRHCGGELPPYPA